MTPRPGRKSADLKAVYAKAAYSRLASRKLLQSRTKLDGVQAGIKHAIAVGLIEPDEKLELAQRALNEKLATAEARLTRLRKASETDWESCRAELDDAWEDLSHCIRRLVARISHG